MLLQEQKIYNFVLRCFVEVLRKSHISMSTKFWFLFCQSRGLQCGQYINFSASWLKIQIQTIAHPIFSVSVAMVWDANFSFHFLIDIFLLIYLLCSFKSRYLNSESGVGFSKIS